MIQFFGLILRLAGQVDAKLFEHRLVDFRDDDRGMRFAAPQPGELIAGQRRSRICCRADGKRDQNLIRMQPWIVIAHVVYFEALDGLNGDGRDQVNIVVYPAKHLQRIQQHCRRRAEQF